MYLVASNRFLKLCCALLTLLLIINGIIPCAKAENAQDKDDLLTLSTMLYDAEGEKYTIAHSTYYDKGQKQAFDIEIEMFDYPFSRASDKYDGNLAVMSLGMALSAARWQTDEEDSDASVNVARFLTEAGFSDIRTDDYSKVPTMYTVSSAIGHRKMTLDDGQSFTLIAVGVCGGNYQNEWESNLTPGEGDVHEGFRAASQLIIDRVAGYIAMNNICGEIKLWISGFSRAAAVTNLTAATMADTGMFKKENIFAYTFATPAAVKNPPQAGYENIFNIICPTDLVPQVMPAEWGYGRYGTDLYLAVPEFSSVIGAALVDVRAQNDKANYNVINNYSMELNLRTRLLLSLLLDVVDNREFYNEALQPALVGIMQKKTVPNALTTLRELMLNFKGSGRDKRADLDEFMDYFLFVFSGVMTRRGLGSNDLNSAGMLYRLLNEHNENSYLASIRSIRLNLFEKSDTAYYVMIKGPVSVTLADEGGSDKVASIKADGTIEDYSGLDFSSLGSMLYMERIGDVTVVCVPADWDYMVTWTAEKDGKVECMQAAINVRATSEYTISQSNVISVKSGDSGVACEISENRSKALPGFSESTADARKLAEFMGIASLGINWRAALMIFTALIGLLLCTVICLAASKKPSRKKHYGFIVWLILCCFGAAALETELAYWFFADQGVLRIIWKAVVALTLVFLFFRVHPPKERPYKSLLPTLVLALAADIVISINFIAGTALFLLCHIVYVVYLNRKAPMKRVRWAQWAVTAAVLVALIIVFYVPSNGSAGWAAAAYAPVLLLMGFSASNQIRRLRLSSILFIISDLLLGMYFALLSDPMIHVAYMLLFYFSLFLMSISDTEALNDD